MASPAVHAAYAVLCRKVAAAQLLDISSCAAGKLASWQSLDLDLSSVAGRPKLNPPLARARLQHARHPLYLMLSRRRLGPREAHLQ